MNRWSLPGPNRYLGDVVDGLRQGQNLVLGIPHFGPTDVAAVLRNRLLEDGWHVVGPLTAGSADPVELLFNGLDLGHHVSVRRTASLLVEKLASGQIVVVNGIEVDAWPTWRKFLNDFEACSRSVGAFDRSLLVAVVQGVPLDDLNVRAAALRALPWHGVVGELDMLLYTSSQMQGRVGADAHCKLVTKVIANLALWDFDVADELIQKSPAELFRPVDLIARLAHASEYGQSLAPTWQMGGLQRFDGANVLHSFLHAVEGDQKGELIMRVWAAQAAEIFPAIELRRRELAKRIRPMVRVPIALDGVSITDLDDLEIGQLARVASEQRLASTIRQSTEKWRRLRNKLAHMVLLEAHEALDSELLGL